MPKLTRITITKQKFELFIHSKTKVPKYLWDHHTHGLGIRLQPSGNATFVVKYRCNGMQRMITLEQANDYKQIEGARDKAREIRKAAREGIDTLLVRQQKEKEEEIKKITFLDVMNRYLKKKQIEKPKTHKAREYYLLKHWSILHNLPIDIDTRDYIEHNMEKLKENHGPIAVNRSRACLRAFFMWALTKTKNRIFEGRNAVAITDVAIVEEARTRVLAHDELQQLWHALDGLHEDFAAIVRLLMLTGQRRSEVSGMRWSELDLDRGVWDLPAERTKNGKPHRVILSDPALSILRQRDRPEGATHLFGSAGFQNFQREKRYLDKKLTLATPWTLHDLRRTFVTNLNEMRIEPHVVEACVNHITGSAKAGVAGVYNLASYEEQKRQAFEMWGEALMAIVTGTDAKVVALKRA